MLIILNKLKQAHLVGVETHLELLKVVPFFCLPLLQIMVKVSSTKPKGMEVTIWFQQESGGRLLVGDPRISSFPFSHHMDAVWVPGEGESIATVSGAKVNGSHHEVFVGW